MITRILCTCLAALLVLTGGSARSSARATAGPVDRPGGLGGAGTRRPAAAPDDTAGRYRAPVRGRLVVVRRFQPPPTVYAAGHLGVDLAAPPDAPILAAAAGRVTFAGPVAGRGVVVIAHPDGVRTEYEPVRPLVAAGQRVTAGAVIGRLAGVHAGCAPSCLHWGARRGTVYVDPMSLLEPLGPVRLLPWPDP